MKEKFIDFMNLNYCKIGACCPVEKWEIYMRNDLGMYSKSEVARFKQKMLDEQVIVLVERDIGLCYEITEFGMQLLRNNFEGFAV